MKKVAVAVAALIMTVSASAFDINESFVLENSGEYNTYISNTYKLETSNDCVLPDYTNISVNEYDNPYPSTFGPHIDNITWDSGYCSLHSIINNTTSTSVYDPETGILYLENVKRAGTNEYYTSATLENTYDGNFKLISFGTLK